MSVITACLSSSSRSSRSTMVRSRPWAVAVSTSGEESKAASSAMAGNSGQNSRERLITSRAPAKGRTRKRLRTKSAASGKTALEQPATASPALARQQASALLRLEARVGLVDHIDLALATDDLAVAVTGLERLERAADLHGRRASEMRKQKSREADLAAGAVPIERDGPGVNRDQRFPLPLAGRQSRDRRVRDRALDPGDAGQRRGTRPRHPHPRLLAGAQALAR